MPVASILLLTQLTSCAEPETKEVVIEKTVVQEVDSGKIANENPDIKQLQKEVLGLSEEAKAEKQTIKKLNKEVKDLQTKNDQLRSEINHKNRVISSLTTKNQKKISREELEIRSLMQDLNSAWMKLPGVENTDYFLDLFLPEFEVSMVSIGIDDKATVKTMRKEEFSGMLKEVSKKEDFTIQIGNVDYVYFDGRNEIYSVVYTAILRSYENEVPVVDRSFVATVTVKRVENQWKIGKYSWVSMGHSLK